MALAAEAPERARVWNLGDKRQAARVAVLAGLALWLRRRRVQSSFQLRNSLLQRVQPIGRRLDSRPRLELIEGLENVA